MDSNPADSTHDAPSVTDPNLVNQIVEELKSQGIFDQIRSDCLAEVDTKPGYQNLRQRVESSVSRYLNKQGSSWKPTSNKAQLRNMLRKHIQDSSYLEAGVEGIVDQVVGPKIMPFIEPDVESIIYKMFGVEKPESNDDDDDDEQEQQEQQDDDQQQKNGNNQSPASTLPKKETAEKLSNISSEDIEMQSAQDESGVEEEAQMGNVSDGSSPGPGLRGDMSPLTPDRDSGKSDQEAAPKGLPLTPPPPGTMPLPPRPPSPRTPPMPPPSMHATAFPTMPDYGNVVEEEEVVGQDLISDVSDTELVDISTPKTSPETPEDSGMPSPPPRSPPPLPPLPPPSRVEVETPPLPAPPPPPPRISSLITARRPPSPLTSPIGSSSDEMDKKSRRPGVKGGSSSVSASDISDAELPASQSEKESSDDLEELERARAELQAKLALGDDDEASEDISESEAAKKSDEDETMTSPISNNEESPKDVETPKDDHEQAKKRSSGNDSDDAPGGSGGGHPGSSKSSESKSDKSKSSSSSKDNSKSDSKDGGSKSSGGHKDSSSSKERRHSKDSKDRHHHHSSHHHDHKKSHKKDKQRHESGSKKSSSGNESSSSHKDKKSKDKMEKDKQKLKDIEAKVKQNFTMKSDRFKDFDMFAPKTPKPKPLPTLTRPLSTTTSTPSPSIRSPSASSKSTQPPVFAKKSKPPASPAAASSASKSESVRSTPTKEKNDTFIVHEPRTKVYPELTVSPQTEGIDKAKQHEDDIAETKRRLEEARQRKMAELKKNNQMKKIRKKSTSSKDFSSSKDEEDIQRYDTVETETKPEPSPARKVVEVDEDSDSDIEWQRKSVSKRRKSARKRYASSSSDEELGVVEVKGEDSVISTRKASQKTESEAVLNDDDGDIVANRGFKPDEVDKMAGKALAYYLARIDENIEIVDVPEVTSEELDSIFEHIYIDGAEKHPGGATKLAELLKKVGGGHPRVVKPVPEWLTDKLSAWKLKRHQVYIVLEAAKVRKRRIYTEAEYDDRCGVQPAMKKARVMLLDDIEQQLARITNQSLESSEEEEMEAAEPNPSNQNGHVKKATKAVKVEAAKKEPKVAPAKKESKVVVAKKKAKVVEALLEDQAEAVKNDNSFEDAEAVMEDQAEVVKKDNSIDDDEAFRGFETDANEDENDTHDRLGYNFGIEDMDLYETLDDDLDIKDDKLEVLMSTTLVTHMRKVLAADKAAMSVLGRIRGSRLPPISDEADEVKTPSDYPLPPSPVSCTPSDSSDKGSSSPQIGSTPTTKLAPDTRVKRTTRRRAAKAN